MAAAVIFDMDGLLIDSEPLWVRAEVEIFGAIGIPLSQDDCARTKGLRIDDVVAYWFARSGSSATRSAGEVGELLVDRVAELVAQEGRGLPGIAGALESARANGRPVALASSSPRRLIDVALARLGLGGAFDVIQSAETEAYGKPHPAIFLRTADRLAVAPADCIVVEDSITGVIAAKAARMRCIAVPFDHPNQEPRFALADLVVGSLQDLTAATFAD